MVNPTTMHTKKEKIFEQVHEGMSVYDRENNHIGTVDSIYLGAAAEAESANGVIPETATEPKEPSHGSFVNLLSNAFDARDRVPEELAERLRYHGYVKIDAGWFGSDRYIMPEQIDSVDGENIYLNTMPTKLVQQ